MTTKENINSILSDKISNGRKNELELFLINCSLEEGKKIELLQIVNNLLEDKL